MSGPAVGATAPYAARALAALAPSQDTEPVRARLGPRYCILAFDADAQELGELLRRVSSAESLDVLEEHSLHEALLRLANRRVDLLLLDARRSPAAVLARLANAARADAHRPRVVIASEPPPVSGRG